MNTKKVYSVNLLEKPEWQYVFRDVKSIMDVETGVNGGKGLSTINPFSALISNLTLKAEHSFWYLKS